jgi:hypothetical protein
MPPTFAALPIEWTEIPRMRCVKPKYVSLTNGDYSYKTLFAFCGISPWHCVEIAFDYSTGVLSLRDYDVGSEFWYLSPNVTSAICENLPIRFSTCMRAAFCGVSMSEVRSYVLDPELWTELS